VAFLDPDPLESEQALRVEEMNADQLVTYLKEYQQALNGLTLSLSGVVEYKRMCWLIEVYGQPDAGRIIKWTYWRHRGRWNNRAKNSIEVIRHARFNSKLKWWVDMMHTEMQEQVARENNVVKTSPASVGFSTSSDL
jgi:hypothetical protein